MWVSLFTTLKAGHCNLVWGDYGVWTDAPKDWKTCQHLFSTWSEGHLVHESCKSPDSSMFSCQGRKLLLGKCRDSMVFVPIKLGGNIFILDFYVSRHINANSICDMCPVQTQSIFWLHWMALRYHEVSEKHYVSAVHLPFAVCLQVPVSENMVATVHTLWASSKHVQPDEQLLHLGLQNTGANQVSRSSFGDSKVYVKNRYRLEGVHLKAPCVWFNSI